MAILIANKGLNGRFKISGNSTGGFKARYVGIVTEAQAFFDRITAAGGTLSATEQNAIIQLVADLKSAGIWTLMKAIYPMVGASAAACAQNLKSSSFTGTFNGSWVFSSNGITSNGTSTYFNTTLSPTVSLTNYNAHSSVYNRLNGGNAGFELGITDPVGGYDNEFLLASYRSNQSVSGLYDYNNSIAQVVVSSTSGKGFFNNSIISSVNHKLYKNGISIGSNVLGNNTLPSNYPIYLGAVNAENTSAVEFNSNQYAFCSIGDGLTDTQSSDLYTAVQAFQTTLSRQV